MKNEEQQLEALNDIRQMMKDSSKFLSLSGLSGVLAGVYALAGAYFGHSLINRKHSDQNAYETASVTGQLVNQILLICAIVLVLSILTALLFSYRKTKKLNQKLFDHTSKKVFWSMAVPLLCGGLFCLALLFNHTVGMVSPAMLLFYGMALLNTSKYTIAEIRYLAYLELALGVVAAFFPGHGLLFWSLGFGVLHIIYGTIMWNKYDRKL